MAAAAAPASPNGGPPPGLAAARQRLEELFEHWLGLEETEAKINEWVRKAERGELPAQPAPSLSDLTNDRRVGTPPKLQTCRPVGEAYAARPVP